jgi:hypothetical protein
VHYDNCSPNTWPPVHFSIHVGESLSARETCFGRTGLFNITEPQMFDERKIIWMCVHRRNQAAADVRVAGSQKRNFLVRGDNQNEMREGGTSIFGARRGFGVLLSDCLSALHVLGTGYIAHTASPEPVGTYNTKRQPGCYGCQLRGDDLARWSLLTP